MIKADNRKTAYFDCDETLVMWGADPKEADTKVLCLERGNLCVKLHKKHIQLLKDLYCIGWGIVVWSQGGVEHATAIVKQLGLEQYVDFVLPKPEMYVDDKPFENQGIRRSYHDDK